MQPHQQRVIDEKLALDGNIERLTGFTSGAIFSALDAAEQSRLQRQLPVMSEYSAILGERIAAFA